MGIRTGQSFADVVQMMRTQESKIDHIVVTGDISQDDSLASYHYCHKVLSETGIPFSWLRGNHDDMSLATSTLYQGNFLPSVTVRHWHIVLLNTQVPGQEYGELTPTELLRLESELAHNSETPILIAMHHHPLPIGSSWMDPSRLKNSDALLTLLKGYPQVQAIIYGHIHQQQDTITQGLRILGTPSTSLQFTPRASDFAIDDSQPGYRRLRLYPDGRLDTIVCRLPDSSWLPDHSQTGY